MTKLNIQTTPTPEGAPPRPRGRTRSNSAAPPVLNVVPEPATPAQPKGTRRETLIAMMRSSGGQSAGELAAAVGWQVHSVRGFIAGTVKKRNDLEVVTTKIDGVTRYQVIDRAEREA